MSVVTSLGRAIGVALGAVAAGCGPAAAGNEIGVCIDGIEPGATIDVSLLEPYTADGSFVFDERFASPLFPRCGDIDALSEQTEMRIEIIDEFTTSGDFPACRIHYGTLGTTSVCRSARLVDLRRGLRTK